MAPRSGSTHQRNGIQLGTVEILARHQNALWNHFGGLCPRRGDKGLGWLVGLGGFGLVWFQGWFQVYALCVCVIRGKHMPKVRLTLRHVGSDS